jgi:hypothetical protein
VLPDSELLFIFVTECYASPLITYQNFTAMKKTLFFALFLGISSPFTFAQQTIDISQEHPVQNTTPSLSINTTSPSNSLYLTTAQSIDNQSSIAKVHYMDITKDVSKQVDNFLKQTPEKTNYKSTAYTISEANPVQDVFAASFNLVLNDAKQAFMEKNFVKCLDLCDNMLAIYKNNPEAYFLKGASNYGLKKYVIAKKFFELAVQAGSKDAEVVLANFQD